MELIKGIDKPAEIGKNLVFIALIVFGRRTGLEKGFSLIEILIVMVILGIASVMVIPMLSSAGSIQLESAADTISSDLEYAKNMAITRQTSYTVDFDSNSPGSYSIKDSDGIIEHPVNKDDYTVELSSFGDVEIASVDFGGDEWIRFNYLGSPNRSGSVVIQAGSVSKTITVEPVTGYVSLE